MNKKAISKRGKAPIEFQKEDFWHSLSPAVKAQIEKGLADIDVAGIQMRKVL